jgi:hypothetical protein
MRMIYEANASSSACRLWRLPQVETSAPPSMCDRPIVTVIPRMVKRGASGDLQSTADGRHCGYYHGMDGIYAQLLWVALIPLVGFLVLKEWEREKHRSAQRAARLRAVSFEGQPLDLAPLQERSPRRCQCPAQPRIASAGKVESFGILPTSAPSRRVRTADALSPCAFAVLV